MALSYFTSWEAFSKLYKFDSFGSSNLVVLFKCVSCTIIVTCQNTVLNEFLNWVTFFTIRDLEERGRFLHLLTQMDSEKFKALVPVLHGNFWGDCKCLFKVTKLHLDLTVLLEIARNEIKPRSFLHSIFFLGQSCS